MTDAARRIQELARRPPRRPRPAPRPPQVGDWNDIADKLRKKQLSDTVNALVSAGAPGAGMPALEDSGMSAFSTPGKQAGDGRRKKHTRQHGRGEETILTPNSSSYGGIKF